MNGVANGLYGGDLPNQINTPWIDFSEQSTIVGWSSFTAKQIRYKIFNKILFLSFNIDGTSNNATTNFSLPFALDIMPMQGIIYAINNSVTRISRYGITVTSGTNIISFDLYSSLTAVENFSNSGRKVVRGQIFYEIN
jgi:hypothetical protein